MPHPGRFLILFGVCFLAGYATLMTPWVAPTVSSANRLLVQISGVMIHAFGGHASVGGTTLRDPATNLAIEMKDGCNGMSVIVLLCSALLAFPATWVQKVKGLLIGCGAIQSVNIVRFISLFYLLQFNRAWFDFAHHYLWESLIMLDALVVFWMWVQGVFRSTPMSDALA